LDLTADAEYVDNLANVTRIWLQMCNMYSLLRGYAIPA